MTETRPHTLIADYLQRLREATASLPPGQRQELLDDIAAHLDDATAGLGREDDAAIRNVLDRLGRPEDIAAAEQDGPPLPVALAVAPQAVPEPTPRLEYAAVTLLTLGSLVPVLGWLAGAVLLWTSRRWGRGLKLLGTLVVPGGPFLLLWLGELPLRCSTSHRTFANGDYQDSQSCTGLHFHSAWLGAPVVLVAVLAPLVVAVVLLRSVRARNR